MTVEADLKEARARAKKQLKGVEQYIILAPDKRLREYWPEADYDESVRTLTRMLELCDTGAKDGRSLAGLSSVQVTLPGRVATAQKLDGKFLGFIDPVIVYRSYATEVGGEGCFSLEKGKFYPVRRSTTITVEHTVKEGRAKTDLHGTAARFAQHEIDHLNGILITDYQGAET